MKGSIRVASLFAGCGGDSLGFLNANTASDIQAGKGFEIVYANDKDEAACNTLEAVFGEKVVHRGDVKKEDDFGSPNVILGGFPCQGFSLAGPRKLDDKRNTLYRELKRAISLTNPEFFVVENVKGFTTLGRKVPYPPEKPTTWIPEYNEIATRILEEFKECGDYGYRLHPAVYNAKDFGVPQERERFILVGERDDLEGASGSMYERNMGFEYPVETHYDPKKVPLFLNEVQGDGKPFTLKPYVTLEQAIKHLPEPKEGEVHDGYFSFRYMSRNRIKKWDEQSFTIPATADQVPLHPDSKGMIPIKEGFFWDVDKLVERECSRARCNNKVTKQPTRTPKIIEAISGRGWIDGPITYKVRDKRMFKDGERPRRMSVKECLIIQGFPEDYPLKGSLIHKYSQVGNAVPPPLMQKIAECIKPYFYPEDYPFPMRKEKVTA